MTKCEKCDKEMKGVIISGSCTDEHGNVCCRSMEYCMECAPK